MSKKNAVPNTMVIAGLSAIITYVPEIGMLRGKFLGLSGYCDFVSDSIQGLQREGEISLREYLQDCLESGIDPYVKHEKVKTFTLRFPESFGERLSIAAAEHQKSLNAFIVDTLNERISQR